MTEGVTEHLSVRRRNLPHWEVGGSTYFVTFRLKGAQPRRAREQSAVVRGAGWQPALSAQERQVVKDAILHWHGTKWHVYLFVVMPDHVHILATPAQNSPGLWFPLAEILRSVKRRSAREINRLRGTRGAIWQAESYDHIVRDAEEFDEVAGYIISNPARVGLLCTEWDYDGLWFEGDGQL